MHTYEICTVLSDEPYIDSGVGSWEGGISCFRGLPLQHFNTRDKPVLQYSSHPPPLPKGGDSKVPKKSLERGVSYIGVERGRKNERGNQSYKGGTFSITLTNFTKLCFLLKGVNYFSHILLFSKNLGNA